MSFRSFSKERGTRIATCFWSSCFSFAGIATLCLLPEEAAWLGAFWLPGDDTIVRFFLRIFESSIFFETKHCQVPFLLSNSMQFSNASHLQIDFAGSVVQRERKVSDSDDVRLCAENENGFSVTFPSVGNIRVDLRGAKDEPSETQSLDEWHVSQVSFHGLRRARFSGRSRPGWSDGQMGRIGRTQKMQMMQMIIRMLRSGRAVEFFFVCPFSTNSVILFVPKCDLHRYASSQ